MTLSLSHTLCVCVEKFSSLHPFEKRKEEFSQPADKKYKFHIYFGLKLKCTKKRVVSAFRFDVFPSPLPNQSDAGIHNFHKARGVKRKTSFANEQKIYIKY